MSRARPTRILSLVLAAASLCIAGAAAPAAERVTGPPSAAALPGETAVQHERIVPLIRTKLWLDRALWRAAPETAPLHEPLYGNLYIVFAEDTGLTLDPIDRRDMAALGLGPIELRTLALANLRRLLPSPEVRRTGGATLVITPTGYGASRVLLDEFWRDPRFRVAGDAVFALATRDMIVLAGSASPEGLDTAKTVAGSLFKSYPFAISGALYTRRGEAIVPYR